MKPNDFLKYAAGASMILVGAGLFHYLVVQLPAKEARQEAARQAAESARVATDATRKAEEVVRHQDQCGRLAAEAFKEGGYSEGVTNTKDGKEIDSYNSHFDPVSGRCFILNITTGYHTRANPKYSDEMLVLFDLTEHKDFGTFYKQNENPSPFMCQILGRNCSSRDEWAELAKAYIGPIE